MAPPEVDADTSSENKGNKKNTKKKAAENQCGFKLRFNSKRLGAVGKSLSPAKHDIVRVEPFGDLLDIKPFKVPHELIKFVVMHTNHTLCQFKYKSKVINFSKLMVKRIFNVPSDDRPVKLLNKSDQCDLRNIYKDRNRAPIAKAIQLLKDCSETNKVMVKRTWALIALATVLCPGTGNMIKLEYLTTLEDMGLVQDFSWDEHLFAAAMEEVAIFQEKKRMQIIYMDHLDIPTGLQNEHVIDYSTPRIRFVCQKDFNWVVKVDKNKLTLTQPFYGKQTTFRSLANTPYSAELTGQGVGVEGNSGQESQAQGPGTQGKDSQPNVEPGANLSASLNGWLQQSFPSIQDLRAFFPFSQLIAPHIQLLSTGCKCIFLLHPSYLCATTTILFCDILHCDRHM